MRHVIKVILICLLIAGCGGSVFDSCSGGEADTTTE
jgi:hypothetical protein